MRGVPKCALGTPIKRYLPERSGRPDLQQTAQVPDEVLEGAVAGPLRIVNCYGTEERQTLRESKTIQGCPMDDLAARQ